MRVLSGAFRAAIALAEGHPARARNALEGLAARHIAEAAGPDLTVAARLYAALAIEAGDAARAAFLLGAAAALLGTEDRRGYDAEFRTPERAREALGDRLFNEEYDRGVALGRAAAVELLRSKPLRE